MNCRCSVMRYDIPKWNNFQCGRGTGKCQFDQDIRNRLSSAERYKIRTKGESGHFAQIFHLLQLIDECIIASQDVSRRKELPIVVNNTRLYRIGEALEAASLSRATYFRWLKAGRIRETQFKDRNGRRLFTEAELQALVNEAKRLLEQPQIEIRFGEAEGR